MAGVSATGLGSGLDIGSIVSALVNAEKSPKTAALNADQAEATSKISAIGSLKSAISSFVDSLTNLGKAETFGGYSTKRSNFDYFTATASEAAAAGSYKIQVDQLAESQKLATGIVTDVTEALGSGSLGFTVDGDSFSVDIDGDDSLQDIVSKINEAEDNVGVTATIINGDAGAQLVLTSNETGTANNITVAATADLVGSKLDTLFNNMTEIQPAKQATVYIDGLLVTSNSNTLDNAITGVTLDLTDADPNETTTLTVSANTSKPKEAIDAFVEAYNEMMTTVKNLSSFNADTETGSVLQGDSTIRSIQSQFRTAISSMFDTGDGTMALTNFGISTTREGTLEVDSDKLDDALKNNAVGLTQFFTAEDTGFAARLSAIGESYTQTGGILDSRNESYERKLDRIADERERLDRKMAAYESRLTAQYNAMDLLVGQLNTQSSTIQARIDSLPGLVRNND
ncbi:flagellar filament capping protein FliD [Shewanella avicenniae]|uniref:Flagellar hook-associated protein 2 n=1 Tax=Shewanella avicenniae TaxID=2814294 RepID=A0ABX7QPD9_9GAMM|nr:flagellar filament capping protein FliD [Shewanella avicenniae]QSX32730.1 flagellar filament capping protein FliD [Shewanella avicenniae]